MRTTLFDILHTSDAISNDDLLLDFFSYVENQNITLYDAQENAILELYDEKNVILNTPTGSGKSLVAMALHFKSLAQHRRSVYTCPIKALVNEKWIALCREFGPENVGLCTGDASVNWNAPILCCTAEILANIALREGANVPIDDIIMDEFHYYSDRERGVAWQIPLLTMPQSRFLLMSATLGDTSFFQKELTRLNGKETVTISSTSRPVPLEFSYSDTLLSNTVEEVVKQGNAPVYVVHFTQLEAAQNAQNFTSLNICTREEKDAIANALGDFKFTTPYGPDIRRWIRQGIGLHHAGLLPKYRILVEQLAQKGLLKIICGTDTLGVGINVPIRTVLLTKLCKYNGEKTAYLSARDFHQICGRAGRKGFDDVGYVVVQAPEHVTENKIRDQKQAQSGKKQVKKKAPEKNFLNWDIHTLNRLITATPEPLTSRFQVTHGMLLNVLSRDSDGCSAIRKLIDDCHDSQKQKEAHKTRAWQLFKSLVNRQIITFVPPQPSGAKLRVNVELQDDFSMDQTLSLYLLETIPLLDTQDPEYPYKLLTLIESILENPDTILRRQLDKIKERKMAEMKAEGVPFEERIEELDKLEHPKPDREFVYSSFNEFSDRHPWVGQENIKPKSIVREMFETYSAFADYIRTYGLERCEGLLLRHVNYVYKVLSQTVPESAKDETLQEMEAYLSVMIRQVDSSMLDEWEKMRDPSYQATEVKAALPPGAQDLENDITKDSKKFTTLIRTRIFSFLSSLMKQDYELALDGINHQENTWTVETLEKIMKSYISEHGTFLLDPEARNVRYTYVKKEQGNKIWQVQQILVDQDEQNDWAIYFEVDLPLSREHKEVVLKLINIGEM
jgi:superfamily II RNA helicase